MLLNILKIPSKSCLVGFTSALNVQSRRDLLSHLSQSHYISKESVALTSLLGHMKPPKNAVVSHDACWPKLVELLWGAPWILILFALLMT